MEDYQRELLKRGILHLSGKIDNGTVAPVVEQLLYLDACCEEVREVNMLINSSGGAVSSAFELVDVLDYVALKITTIGIGQVLSGALVILMAGDHRRISRRASILSHRFWKTRGGDHADILSHRKEEDLLHERLLKHYTRCTGLSAKQLEKYLLKESDTWLSPEEAIEYKLADEIFG